MVIFFDIELTNHCNVTCLMCPRESLKRSRGVMDKSVFNQVIEKVKEMDLKFLVFSGFGEPLLNPNIISYLDTVKRLGDVKVQLNTNGGLLTPVLIDELLNKELDAINFNINAINKVDYGNVTPGIDFDLLLERIDYLNARRIKLNSPIEISIQSSVIELDSAEAVEFTGFWHNRGIDKVVLQSWNNRAGHLSDMGSSYNEYQQQPYHLRYCNCILFIAWDGEVYYCSHDLDGEYKKGHISKLKRSWLKKEEIELCGKCNLSEMKTIMNPGSKKNENIA